MARKRYNQQGRSQAQFVQLLHYMMDSDAWRDLDPKSRAVWLELMRRYDGRNNGLISLSIREAAILCKIGNNSAALAFTQLIEHGFLKITVNSSFNYKEKKARRWALTHLATEKAGPTNEWRSWKIATKENHSLI